MEALKNSTQELFRARPLLRIAAPAALGRPARQKAKTRLFLFLIFQTLACLKSGGTSLCHRNL